MKTIRIFAAAAAALAAGSALAAPVQWTVGSGGNDHYYEFVQVTSTWTAARADALSRTHLGMQGYLATITSAAENNFVASVAGNITAYIGGTDQGEEGKWVWADGPEAGLQFWQGGPAGTALGYENWNGGEPNNVGDEDALHTNFGAVGGWNDVPLSFGYSYVVEYSARPVSGVPAPVAGLLLLGALGGLALRRR